MKAPSRSAGGGIGGTGGKGGNGGSIGIGNGDGDSNRSAVLSDQSEKVSAEPESLSPNETHLLSEDDPNGSIIGAAARGVAGSYRLEESRRDTEALDVGGCAGGGGGGVSDATHDTVEVKQESVM